jgi:hypothetical protein
VTNSSGAPVQTLLKLSALPADGFGGGGVNSYQGLMDLARQQGALGGLNRGACKKWVAVRRSTQLHATGHLIAPRCCHLDVRRPVHSLEVTFFAFCCRVCSASGVPFEHHRRRVLPGAGSWAT